MGTITLPNFRVSGTDRARVRLKDGGVYVEWSRMTEIKAWLYSVEQKAISGRFDVQVDPQDGTRLQCVYSAQKPQYPGVNKLILQCKYEGAEKAYDKPLWNFVRWTADQAGEEITMEDPEVDVEIVAEDMSSSVLDEATAAALSAADKANEAAEQVPLEVLTQARQATQEAREATEEAEDAAEHATPHIGENGHWWKWDKASGAYVDTGEDAQGPTGNGVQSVEQTQTSEESEGENVVTVTMTDGTEAQFTIRNGKQGERGLQGVPGVANAKYKQVDTLPTASADTMDFIYLTPTQTAGVYDMSYTEQDGNTYTWKPLGTTAIQLADYATKTEVSRLQQEVNDIKPSLGEQIISANLYTSRYIDKDTGEMVSGASSSRVYEYTGIISGGVYYVSGYVGANTQTCLGAWYKADGTFISSFIPSTGTATQYDNEEQTAPADAAILRVFGTTTVTAQVIKGIETRISSIDRDIINLNERLDEIAYIPVSALRSYDSQYIDKDTGDLVSGASSSLVYEYSGIVSGAKYVISGKTGANTQTCLGAWYKADGTFISSFIPSTGTATQYDNEEQTAPADAAILRVFGTTTVTPSVYESIKTQVATLSNEIDKFALMSYVGDGGKEKSIAQSAIYNSSYVSNETGELVSGSNASKTYEFRGIIPGKTYKLTGRVGANTATCLVAYYDENGNFISCELPSTGTAHVYEDYVATIPDGCAMLRVLGYFTGGSNNVIPTVKVSYIITNVLDSLVQETFNGKSICKNYGKSIVVLGGSHSVRDESESAKDIWREKIRLAVYSAGVGSCGITAGITMYGWTNGTVTYYTRGGYNDAIGSRVWDDFGYLSDLTITARSDSSITLSDGVTYTRDTDRDYYNNSQTKVSRLLSKDGLNKKIYLVWLSTNDYRQNLPLGTFSDYTETDNYDATKKWSDTSHIGTICGGFNFIVKTIRENNPTAEIYVFSSIRYFNGGAIGYDPFTTDANASGKNFYEYQEEILKAAQAAGCAVLDQFLLQGVGISNYTAFYQSDHLHMNVAGYEKIGWMQTEFLANGK